MRRAKRFEGIQLLDFGIREGTIVNADLVHFAFPPPRKIWNPDPKCKIWRVIIRDGPVPTCSQVSVHEYSHGAILFAENEVGPYITLELKGSNPLESVNIQARLGCVRRTSCRSASGCCPLTPLDQLVRQGLPTSQL